MINIFPLVTLLTESRFSRLAELAEFVDGDTIYETVDWCSGNHT